MAWITPTSLGRRLRLAVAGAVVLTWISTVTAAASMPPTQAPASELTRRGTGASSTIGPSTTSSSRPRTPVPGFLLDRGRYTRFDAPGAQLETTPLGINDRGQLVGSYENTQATAESTTRQDATAAPRAPRWPDRGDERRARRSP